MALVQRHWLGNQGSPTNRKVCPLSPSTSQDRTPRFVFDSDFDGNRICATVAILNGVLEAVLPHVACVGGIENFTVDDDGPSVPGFGYLCDREVSSESSLSFFNASIVTAAFMAVSAESVLPIGA